MEGNAKSEAGRGGGGVSWSFCPGAPSKINKQAISYFTVNWCFKATTIVFIDDRLLNHTINDFRGNHNTSENHS